jgi:hypothetical protein
MLAVDLLHDFELGVWKSVFQHLIRLLYAIGGEEYVQILNEWYYYIVISEYIADISM